MHEGLDDDAQPGEAPRELDHLQQAEGAEHRHVGLPDVDEQGGGDDHDHVEDVPGLEEIELRSCEVERGGTRKGGGEKPYVPNVAFYIEMISKLKVYFSERLHSQHVTV